MQAQQQLCLACSSTIPPSAKPASVYVHGCCQRPVCATCIAQNPRLVTFCPLCEDAQAAFKKGPRPDVTRAGEVVFDAEALLQREHSDASPPSYSEVQEEKGIEKHSTFVLDDNSEDEAETETDKGKKPRSSTKDQRQAGPSLLKPQPKSAAVAEVDLIPPRSSHNTTPEATTTNPPTTSFRRQVDPHTPPATSSVAGPSTPPTSACPGDGQTRQYYLRKSDTLPSISIRFGVSANELCLLNALPRAVLSTSPHLLHTRSFILLPAHAVEKQLAANPSLAHSLQGPPQRSAREKTVSARKEAEAKFRAMLAKGTSGSGSGGGETVADDKAARAYVGLAEDEMRFVNFGEGLDEHGLPLAYDGTKEEEVQNGGEKGEDQAMLVAQQDTARRLRFEAILKHALAKWEMDSDWERQQRANGIDPSTISEPLPPSTSSSAQASSDAEHKRSSKVGSWFTRALHSNSNPESSEQRSSSSKPRHVVALSSSAKLPTHLARKLPAAHKGPINTARYSSTGRHLLTGGSDRTVRLWNAKAGGEAIQTYTEHSHEVLALDISRDNARFVSGGGDKSIFVWDVASGSVVRRFGGHMGKINDVKLGGKEGDASVVVAGGFDGVVRVFDLRAQGAWRPIMELKDARDAVTSLAVSEDRIYSGSVDGVLRCYDLRAGQLRSDTMSAPITSLFPSRLGTSVLVATLDSTLRLLDAKDGTLLHAYTGHKHASYRCRAVLTPDENGVVAGDEDGNLFGWDTVSGERVPVGSPSEASAHAKPILWIEPNPDASAREMVSAGADGTVNIWTTP